MPSKGLNREYILIKPVSFGRAYRILLVFSPHSNEFLLVNPPLFLHNFTKSVLLPAFVNKVVQEDSSSLPIVHGDFCATKAE